MKVPDKIPEWLAMLPKDALLDTKDIASIFGYKNSHSAASNIRIAHPNFPEPDTRGRPKYKYAIHGVGSINMMRWRAMTIRNFIRQHNRGELK